MSPTPPSPAFTLPPPAGPAPEVRFERLDPRFDRLVPPDTEAELLADISGVPGPHWLEGPAWDERNGCLLFSDVKGNTIWCWDRAGGARPHLHPSGYTGPQPPPMEEPGSNGLCFDGAGRLTICEHGDRRVTRLEADGSRTVLAERWQGKRFHSPNDVVCRSDGDLVFTDPPYGLAGRFEDPGRELPFNGVFRIPAAGGEPQLVTSRIDVPNGLGFSPDEATLYVTEGRSEQRGWLACLVASDGTVGEPRWLFEATGLEGYGGPDGLTIDRRGILFASGFERVLVLAPDGTHLGSIRMGSITTNVAWGEDGSTLFVTTETRLWRLRVATAGAAFS